MRTQTKQWTTSKGQKIRICDMSLEHLKNTIDMLIKGAEGRYQEDMDFLNFPEPNGEMAQLDFDNAFDNMLDSGMGEYLPEIYWNLIDDLERREYEERNTIQNNK